MTYQVLARNLSHASENKIHDDTVARRFGFHGALVPGVEVYAYMTHLPAARWGVEWLQRGTAACKFAKPVYDGKWVSVSWAEHAKPLGSAEPTDISVESTGERCASGSAALPDVVDPRLRSGDGGSVIRARAEIQDWSPAPVPPPELRPEANEETLSIGRRLSSQPMHMSAERLHDYLRNIGETEPLYAREKLVHPAFMLRLSNLALKDNVKLSAWIHTGSVVRHCGLAHAGDSLAAHGVVAANYERKGHAFVELDVIVVTNEERPVAQVRHTAIYRLRAA